MGSSRVMEFGMAWMEIVILESGGRARLMVMEFMYGRQGTGMRASGRCV